MILVPVTQEHNMQESNFKRYELRIILSLFLSICYYLTDAVEVCICCGEKSFSLYLALLARTKIKSLVLHSLTDYLILFEIIR